jgi:hypothetical protein
VLAAICVAALLAATVAAMAVTQHLRSEGPVVSDIRMKIEEGPRYRVCFRVARADRFEVALVDSSGVVVRVLASDVFLESEPPPGIEDDRKRRKASARCFDWDGSDQYGEPVPRGPYRLRLTRDRDGLELVSGEKLTIPSGRGS